MRRDRHAKLQEQLAIQELDGLILLGTNNVTYATGANTPGMDSGRAGLLRPVAAVVRGEDAPHLYTPYPDGAPEDVHLHDDPTSIFALFAGRVGVDEVPMEVELPFVSATGVLGAAKLCKTADELGCIREAQRINELAMEDVLSLVRSGVRQIDLTALFLRRVFELGATSNGIDPIWQVMPPAAPWNFRGDIAFPMPSTDRSLAGGDVIWVDTGITYEGYASDFGQTWVVGAEPPRRQYERWRNVVDAVVARCRPGVSALELCDAAIAANNGVRPWIGHFYLAHGVGTDSAEMPLIGTDGGGDAELILAPGMVLVLEPVIWEDGSAGFRAEDIIAITEDGWMPLSTPS